MEIYVLKYFLYQLPPGIYICLLSAIRQEVETWPLTPRIIVIVPADLSLM